MIRSTFNRTSRRSVLAGTAAVGATAALAACGGNDDNASSSTPTQAATTAPAATEGATPSATSSAAGSGSQADALAATSEIPVGGGKIFSAEKVVVTQPAAGSFKGFSAVCTHQGCLVTSVAGGEIVCPCHASHFSVTDGSVTSGPAPSPLPAVTVTAKDGEITLG